MSFLRCRTNSFEPVEQGCLHFWHLLLTTCLSDLLLQVWGFCLFILQNHILQNVISAAITVFFTADNAENFLQDDKYISFPVGQQQQRLTGMKIGIKSDK